MPGLRSLIAVGCVLFSAQTFAVPFDAIYVLGDSLSDQGNLLQATTQLGAGIPDTKHYFKGRFSNGLVYTDFLAQKLGLELKPTLAGGTNFSFGGTRTDYNVAELTGFPKGAFAWTLRSQTSAFSSRGVSDPNALYVVFSGSNDIGDILRQRLDPNVVIPNAADGIKNAVLAFQAAGAKTVVVPKIPDLGLVPRITELEPQVPGISKIATGLSDQFNVAVDAALAGIGGVDIVRFDTFSFLREVVSDPGSFGFSNVSKGCYSGFVLPDPSATECPNPDGFLFWDIEHPSTRVHSIIADRIAAALVPEPSTLAAMLLGLCIMTRVITRRTGSARAASQRLVGID